jgi:SNF2 family DNA or RNA helicase
VRQWQQEAWRWGRIKAVPVDGHSALRARLWKHYPGVLLATPHIVLNDSKILHQCHFDLVVCDDVSTLKNPGKITSAIRKIPRQRSWCLSGTPLENKPEDLVNVMEFVHPGLFSARARAKAPSKERLHERIRPFILRRRKTDHLNLNLPEKQSIGPVEVELQGKQLEAYRRAEREEWQALQASGIQITKLHVFSRINALIRLCNFHPDSKESAKLERVAEQLDEVLDSSQSDAKAVLFSHSVDTLRFLADNLQQYRPLLYHGGLDQTARQQLLNAFQADHHLLLMSTKAGRFGLNLQQANYVFHFDRSWNPVDEMQAEDRCWRMGQQKPVFVYRFTALHTIEERIHEVLMRKRGQFDKYVDSLAHETDEAVSDQWTLDQLVALLKPAE